MDHARAILGYWFGKLPLSPGALEERMGFWFGGNESPALRAARDLEINQRFAGLARRAASGDLAAWAASPRRRLALILLLDQVPRNIFRGTARAFLQDRAALELSLSGLQLGADAALDPVERIFFYLPLQHAESAAAQEESLGVYRRLLEEAPAELRPAFERTLDSARQHHAIVTKFGRFPHRNAVLGRVSTPEECEWLRAGSERFGQ